MGRSVLIGLTDWCVQNPTAPIRKHTKFSIGVLFIKSLLKLEKRLIEKDW